jgi:hypothetical protein
MSPNELQILRLAQELKRVNKLTVARRMGISTQYAGCLLGYLCRYGYLAPISSGANPVYAFTEEGRACLLGDLLQLRARLQKKIDWLTYQRDGVNEKINRLAVAEVEEVKVEAPSAPPAQAEAVNGETAQVGGS